MPMLTDPPHYAEWFYFKPAKGREWPFFRAFPLIVGGVTSVVLLAVLVIKLVSIVTAILSSDSSFLYSDALISIAVILYVQIIFATVVSYQLLTATDVAVSDEQVWIAVIPGKGLTLDRSLMSTARVFEVPFLDPTGRKRSLIGHSYAVEVEGLTPFHRLVGLMHRLWLRPVFIVSPDHENHDDLLERIQMMAGYDAFSSDS